MKRWLWAAAAAAAWAGVSPAAGPVPAATPATSTVVGQVAEGEVRLLKTTGLPDRRVKVLRLPRPEDRTVLAEVQDLTNGSSYTVPVRVLAAAKIVPELSTPAVATTAPAALAGRPDSYGRPPARPPVPAPEAKKPSLFGKLFGEKEPTRPTPAAVVPTPSAVETTAATPPPVHSEPTKPASATLPFVDPTTASGGTVTPVGAVDPPPALILPPFPTAAAPPAIVPPSAVTPPIPAPAVPPILPPVPPPAAPRQPDPPPPNLQPAPAPVLAPVPAPPPVPEPTPPQPEAPRPEVAVPPPARPVEHRLPAAADNFRPAAGPVDSVMEDVTRLVTELHTASRPSIRELAATSLVEAGHASRPAVQAALARAATTDETPSVRATCIRLLSNLGYRDVGYLDHLKSCEESSVPELRAAAAAALAKLTSGR